MARSAGDGPVGGRAPVAWLAGVQALAVLAMALLTPPGEAPDEPAHLRYVAHLATTGSLPAPDPAAPTVGYEAYQPPLGYLPAAVVATAVGLPVLGEEDWPRNREFSFHAPSRAFARGAEGDPRTRRIASDVAAVRLTGLLWLGLTTLGGVLAVRASLLRADVLCPFLLAPQLVFLHAVVTNDSAAVALTTLALCLLLRLGDRPEVRPGVAAAVGASAGLAIGCKASAVLLLPLVAAAAVHWWRGGRRRAALAIAAGALAPLAGWVALNLGRFGALLPEPPSATGLQPETVRSLVELWIWLPGLAVSFWGKFGWLNVPLPAWAYLWFFVPGALVVAGAADVFRGRPLRWVPAIALGAVACNLALLLVYWVAVDAQAQGRYLWPSWLGMAVLASRAADRWWPGRDLLAPSFALSALTLAVACLTLARAF